MVTTMDHDAVATSAHASPLGEIERIVRNEAKNRNIDVDTPDGPARMMALVREVVATWSDERSRRGNDHHVSDLEGLISRAYRNVAAYGPLTDLLDDQDVWEIMVNAPDLIFVKRHSGGAGFHGEVFHDNDHVIRTVTKLLDDSGASHRKLDQSEGLQDAQLDSGARVHIVHGDIARGGNLMVNIRKFSGVTINNLAELVKRGSLTQQAAEFLGAAVRSRLSIVFAGAPGAGKTTLLSCCAAELDPTLRAVIAEEVFECDVPLMNVASMQTRPSRPERDEVDLRKLVAGFLRMAPDVAIVGEVRDKEALPLLLTLSSGVTGYTTIHSASARAALSRLRFLAQLSDQRDLSVSALNSLVSEAIDIVVHTERGPDGPRVTEIIAVEDLVSGHDSVSFTTTGLFEREHGGELVPTGDIPMRVGLKMGRFGNDVHVLLGSKDGPR